MRQRSLGFLVREKEILLSLKQTDFGQGKWNGFGGKLEKGETIEECLIRESQEEILVTPTKYHQVATLNFSFTDNPDWNQQVIAFLVDSWQGQPGESEEMIKPTWFLQDQLPQEMWDADRIWLPKVLAGQIIKAKVIFDKNQKLVEYKNVG